MTPVRHPVRWLVPRLALAVLVGLGLALVVDVVRTGGPSAWLARHRLPAPYVGHGSRVDIGGRSLYLDCRGAGTPTVVFESGMGDGAGAWTAVHDAVATTSRACVYDRAGRGTSDSRGNHTLAAAASDLRMLLAAAGETGPFVLVGHSLGGDHVRVFADRYRSEVAGLALIDAFDPDLESTAIHPLLGSLRPEYAARLDGLRALVAAVEDLDWAASEEQLRATDLDGLPIIVLRAPRAEPRLDQPSNDAIRAAWAAVYAGLSPGNVAYEIAWGAGHVIQVDRPDLVIDAVRRLVEGARAS
jgi:pimeloyl-ACP methyl ester carboxylesterase